MSTMTHSLEEITLALLAEAGPHGLTVAECKDEIEDHHGSMSATLSMLHYEEVVSLLKETREGCKVYVLTRDVNGRETVARRGKTNEARARDKAVLAVVEEFMRLNDTTSTGSSTLSKAERFPALFASKVRAAFEANGGVVE